MNVSGSSLKERGQGCGDRPESCVVSVELIVTPQSPQGIPPKPKPLWAGPLLGGIDGGDIAATHCPPPLGVMAHTWRVRGGFLSFLGGGSYRIRILMYFDVSCMYLACILKDTCIPYVS